MVGDSPASAHAGSQLNKELCSGFMDLVHKFLQLFEHLLVFPQPCTQNGITDRCNAGNDQTNVILCPLQKEFGGFLVKMAACKLHPAKEGRTAHGTQNNAVLDLHITDLPGGK